METLRCGGALNISLCDSILSEPHGRSSCRSQLRTLPPGHALLSYPVLLREMEGADGNTMQNSAGQVRWEVMWELSIWVRQADEAMLLHPILWVPPGIWRVLEKRLRSWSGGRQESGLRLHPVWNVSCPRDIFEVVMRMGKQENDLLWIFSIVIDMPSQLP